MANREMFHNGFDPNLPHTQEMTLEEFLFCSQLVQQITLEDFDGVNLSTLDRSLRLSRVLTENPADFYNQWQLETNSEVKRAVEFINEPGFTGSVEDMQRFTGVKL